MDVDQQSKFAIHEAAREGKTARKDDDDRVALHWACSYNHLPVVELLVSRIDFDPDVQDGSGWTPLMIAASLPEGDGLVDLLLNKGADTNAKSALLSKSLCIIGNGYADKRRASKITMARSDALNLIISSLVTVQTNSRTSNQTALHFTASKNNLDIARKIIAHKATARVKDKRGQLPLHRAAAVGSVPMVKLLLDNKSPLNATDIAGYTALHHGAFSKSLVSVVESIANILHSHFRRTRRHGASPPEIWCGNGQERCRRAIGNRISTRQEGSSFGNFNEIQCLMVVQDTKFYPARSRTRGY
ncbi:MAG: hypothetical protein Q9191_000676 [Dirinaria sp. TL-2023a]